MIIVGAGGHARELLDVLLSNNYTDEICFYDDYTNISSVYDKYKVFNNFEHSKLSGLSEFCLGVGNPALRYKMFDGFVNEGLKPVSIVSQKSFISMFAHLETGLNIMPFATLSTNSYIGKGSLIHYYSSVHHDVVVGEFCEISPGARLLGGSSVGALTSIGTNAVVLPNVKIGSNCKIGAGAVVTKNVSDGAIVKGIPAK